MLEVIMGLGCICSIPLILGLILMILYVVYCVVFAWLSIIPFFKGHFRFMCGMWYLGLAVVSKTWKIGIIGIVVLSIASKFI